MCMWSANVDRVGRNVKSRQRTRAGHPDVTNGHGRARILAGLAVLVLGSACSGESDGGTFDLGGAVAATRTGGGPNGARSAAETPIVFSSERAEEGAPDLYVMAPDGSNLTRLTSGGSYFLPSWSPDGEALAFRMGGENADVGLVRLDGSPPVLLTQGQTAAVWRMAVHWSPDGTRVAFASQSAPDESLSVYAVSRSGGQPQRLLPNVPVGQDTATWAWANEARIVYTEYEGQPGMHPAATGRTTDVWLIDAEDSSEPVNLTEGRLYAPGYPQWSPDGTRIVLHGYPLLPDGSIEGFGEHAEAGYSAPGSEVFVIDVESRELTRITDNPWNDDKPVWSPDGKSLLVEGDRDGDKDIWLVPLDSPEQARNLTLEGDLGREDAMPSWYWPPR
jgi:Tol biopolymer transport system component